MGIYDRDYVRDEYGPGAAFGPGRSMVITIIVINAVVFLANLLLTGESDLIMYSLSANVYSLIRPWLWWQLLTSGFAHDPDGIRHILFNMLGLFFLGRNIEQVLGRWEFLRFYLIAIVLGSIFHCARVYFTIPEGLGPDGVPSMNPALNQWAIHLMGASGAVTAVIMLFIFYFPRVQLLLFFVIPVPAWLVGVMIIVFNLFGREAQVAYDVHLVGAAFACAYRFLGWNFGRMIPASFGGAMAGIGRALRPRPKLRVHSPENDSSAEVYDEEDAQADQVLAKIEREGIGSLTASERKVLDAYSRRMRQKHR